MHVLKLQVPLRLQSFGHSSGRYCQRSLSVSVQMTSPYPATVCTCVVPSSTARNTGSPALSRVLALTTSLPSFETLYLFAQFTISPVTSFTKVLPAVPDCCVASAPAKEVIAS